MNKFIAKNLNIFLGFFVIIIFMIALLPKQSHENPKYNFQPEAKSAVFHNQKISIPEFIYQKGQIYDSKVLGQTSGKKRIEIDLTNQRLYAYEGDQLIYNFLVSTGKWGRTPTGTFHIWIKLRYVLMQGGSQELGTYYYLPNVPFTMFFANEEVPSWRGYGIHGTYWHDNFGHPMSHGCINMRNEDVEQLYYWAEPNLNGQESISASADNPGTEIVIYGVAPVE